MVVCLWVAYLFAIHARVRQRLERTGEPHCLRHAVEPGVPFLARRLRDIEEARRAPGVAGIRHSVIFRFTPANERHAATALFRLARSRPALRVQRRRRVLVEDDVRRPPAYVRIQFGGYPLAADADRPD